MFDDEIYRKIIKPLNYKTVSEERYEQLVVPLKAMGVTILRGGEEIERHLDLKNAEASNFGKDVVMFREKISVSGILEETYHIVQNRNGMNDDKSSELRELLNEIDAKEYLLRVAQKYSIPRDETENTKKQLEVYKMLLKKYYEKRGGEDAQGNQ